MKAGAAPPPENRLERLSSTPASCFAAAFARSAAPPGLEAVPASAASRVRHGGAYDLAYLLLTYSER